MKKTVDSQELYSSDAEAQIRTEFYEHFQNSPIPQNDILNNLGLFLNSKNLSRILFMDHIYRLNLEVMGSIFEFGTRWGQNSSLFAALRGIYEPFNRHRKIVCFDTFEGFPSLSENDNLDCKVIREGALSCTKDYEKYLEKTLDFQEKDNPLSHIKKYEICKGDACLEIEKYLDRNPETIISMAYFDFDLYEPTKVCLEKILDRVVKGSVLVFDELNDPDSPGETKAVMDVFGLRSIRLKRYKFASRVSYFIVE